MNRFTKEKMTIGDVARLAGVSKATVSSVLNDKSNVSKSTKARVADVMQRLNYRPNHIARSLSSRQTRSMGLVVKQFDNPYFTKIMRGVFEFFSGRGYTVLLGSSQLSPEKERQSVDTLLRHRVDGLILSPLQAQDADLRYLSPLFEDQIPLVFLERVPNIAANVVDIGNEKGAYDAVAHLIRLQHRKIAYLAGPDFSIHNRERLSGFQRAMMEHGLPLRTEWIRKAGVYIEDGYFAARSQFEETDDRPTALFCFNDLVAIGAMNALFELGLRVPDDVSIIGFDDIEFCESVRVPLASVHVPILEMGTAAAALLLKQIEHHGASLRETVELKATFIPRASCGLTAQ